VFLVSVEIRSRYGEGYIRYCDVEFTQKSMTKQSFRDECNINTIMARYEKTGVLVDPLQMRQVKPLFDDFSNIPDYQEAQNAIIEAENLFNALPSSIRKRFGNDPALLLDFMSDPDNYDEAVRLGIVSKSETETKIPEPSTNVKPVSDPAFKSEDKSASSSGESKAS
jgi:phage internal scaffolding protein